MLKGIYTFEAMPIVCVAKHDDGARTPAFEAPSGSDRMLIRLKLAAFDRKPDPSPPRSSAEDDEAREADFRRLIVGSWAMTDSRGTLTIIFSKEGTFRGSRVYSQAGRTIFGVASDSASGPGPSATAPLRHMSRRPPLAIWLVTAFPATSSR